MSGYANKQEVSAIVKSTLAMEGRDPADYYVSRIANEAFYHRGHGHGFGAREESVWRSAVMTHRRPHAVGRMSSSERESLQRVVEFGIAGAREDYETVAPEDRSLHVYKHFCALQQWLGHN